MVQFKEKPICEECKKSEATAFVFFEEPKSPQRRNWKFRCQCNSDQERYYFP